MLELYKNIKKLRTEKGLTQTQLAKMVGYADKGMISRVESGLVDLSRTKIEAFAVALGTSASELMGWNEGLDNLSADTVISFIKEQDLQEHVQTLARLSPTHKQRIYGMIEAFAMEEGIELVKIEFQ